MIIKLGKVVEYDSGVGRIVTDDEVYMFLDTDIISENIEVNDLVYFRGEVVNGMKRAYFVKKYVDEKNYTRELKKDYNE